VHQVERDSFYPNGQVRTKDISGDGLSSHEVFTAQGKLTSETREIRNKYSPINERDAYQGQGSWLRLYSSKLPYKPLYAKITHSDFSTGTVIFDQNTKRPTEVLESKGNGPNYFSIDKSTGKASPDRWRDIFGDSMIDKMVNPKREWSNAISIGLR
jgi:hypothetical protein